MKKVSQLASEPVSQTIYIGSLFEVDSDGTTRNHIFAGSNRFATIDSSGDAYFYHSDHLGSSNIITDHNGQETQRLEYLPFGQVNVNSGTDVANHKFTGKELDNSTGLYFYGARYYDPEIGRFITADPTVQHPYDPQDLNRYSYCRDNPINYIDPTGYGFWDTVKKWAGKIVGAVVAVVATITTGNPALGFAAFNCADAIVSGGQALYYGANPAQVLGAVGIGIALSKAVPFPNFANPALQIGVAAVRGAAISTMTQVAIQGGKGKYGPTAAWGGGMGATAGFLSSQQFQNWQGDHGFKSDQGVINKFLDDGRIQEAWDYARGRIGIEAWDARYLESGWGLPYERSDHVAMTLSTGKTLFRNSIYYREPTALKMVIAHEYQHHLQAVGNMYQEYSPGHGHRHEILNLPALEVAADRAVLQNAGRLGLTPKIRQDVINHMKTYGE